MGSGGGGGGCKGSGGAGVKEEGFIVTAVAGATLFMFTFIDLALIWFLQAPPPLCVSRSREVLVLTEINGRYLFKGAKLSPKSSIFYQTEEIR